jgi:hypothetical protein
LATRASRWRAGSNWFSNLLSAAKNYGCGAVRVAPLHSRFWQSLNAHMGLPEIPFARQQRLQNHCVAAKQGESLKPETSKQAVSSS